MGEFARLPLPQLSAQSNNSITYWTDDALASSVGICIAFCERSGGVSPSPFDSLNTGGHVGDDSAAVLANRARGLDALGFPAAQLVVPSQVHGTDLVFVDDGSASAIDAARAQAKEGADGVLVTVPQVAALLNFADCTPVIIASPTGHFAVVHAGWRGALAGIAGKALKQLAARDAAFVGVEPSEIASECNVYIGAYIHSECFEVSEEIAQQFADRFGAVCVPVYRHVDMGQAVRASVREVGATSERIADLDVCTACSTDRFFSYRASGGACGRHCAVAVRREA